LNIYQQKSRWKLWLGIFAFVIVGGTLIYSNYLVNKIAKQEQAKVRLWAEAVVNRAKLVHKMDSIFTIFEREDRKNIELWAQASIFIAQSDINSDFEWPLKILSNNTTIPVIITNSNDEINNFNNFPNEKMNDTAYIKEQLIKFKEKNNPLDVSYEDLRGGTIKQSLYYDDSYIYSELKTTIDDLVKSFISETVINSASVPVIITNETKDSLIAYGNIEELNLGPNPSPEFLIGKMKEHNSFSVELSKGNTNYIFYMNSYVIRLLQYFPFIFLAIIGVFLVVAYLLFSVARRSEQNQVWVGMSKETAHQLGTPLSSLMGWIEILKLKNADPEAILEMEKDIARLQIVTERFSKIGSTPELKDEDIDEVLSNIIAYMKLRTSGKISYDYQNNLSEKVLLPLNRPLFEWVLENLFRNAIDAINGPGKITIEVSLQNDQYCVIDVSDTGKGIPKNQHKVIFRPGYTTKKRGWGLGLSLTKRIVDEYHRGKIFVKQSEVNKGTTFRILLRLS
jgi:two-component system, sporulation sensor kinase D